MKFICSLIVVSDIVRSRNFYENILGQRVKYDFGENVSFEGDFAIHLQDHYKSLINNRKIKIRCHNFELYFEEDNIEEFEEKLVRENVEFVHRCQEQPWRQKVIRFYDPDEHIIEVGESMEYLSYRLHLEGLAIKKIVEITSMPADFIQSSILKYK